MSEKNQQFDTFEDWVNHAPEWLTKHSEYHAVKFRALCFDVKGHLCKIGRDFEIARDQGTFPIRWIWPDQISQKLEKIGALEKACQLWATEATRNGIESDRWGMLAALRDYSLNK